MSTPARATHTFQGRHLVFFAGHWLHYEGCLTESAIGAAAAGAESEIRVADPRLFRVGIGRYDDAGEDLAICGLGPDGRPDWSRVEQVELLAVDRGARTIRVRRGAFGTAPPAFGPARRTWPPMSPKGRGAAGRA